MRGHSGQRKELAQHAGGGQGGSGRATHWAGGPCSDLEGSTGRERGPEQRCGHLSSEKSLGHVLGDMAV